MKKSLLIILISSCVVFTGCAVSLKLTLMPRDSGKIYIGQLDGDGMGSGTATIDVDGVICSGPVVRVSSSEVTAIGSTLGSVSGRNFSSTSIGVGGSGDTTIKVLLSCNDGSGIRCELSGQNRRGGGVCVDDKGRNFDVLANPK